MSSQLKPSIHRYVTALHHACFLHNKAKGCNFEGTKKHMARVRLEGGGSFGSVSEALKSQIRVLINTMHCKTQHWDMLIYTMHVSYIGRLYGKS